MRILRARIRYHHSFGSASCLRYWDLEEAFLDLSKGGPFQ
nr:unnamed protein product [Brassica oleracea]